ncbi:type III sulfide quinone reductase, selenoprotein subtype [Pelodictyon luteolum]|uniref:Sulfide dehydrogenase, flavoprotein subunit, putative n=1 Tax=Chlorobium luteolum (strain DSM 273 / BCRC 81028 / 2530) TaxID=319225 RepID=Q3B6S2_CHLL3|nr:FAD/NAD(P)-binding oxidoreductase [Pelodictyon luteolum]ABB22959.1 sulfide dehydrogenase, flavoprotein subunit, putative [Pelodictyon luteolum DSM 273]
MAKKIVVLGAGTAGTIVSNNLRRHLSDDWEITVIDRDDRHIYQPGLLFVPFGIQKSKTLVKSRKKFILPGVKFVLDEITHVDPEKKVVKTRNNSFDYDFLVVSTGCKVVPEENDGLLDAWGKNAFTFYYLEAADVLHRKLREFDGGKLVMDIAELPFKCPVAPIEFVFLADWYFKKRGIRNKVEIELVTPLQAAFTKPKAAAVFSRSAKEKNIKITTGFELNRVDGKAGYIESVQGEKVNYDMLVVVPTTVGDKVITDSGMDDGIGYVPTHQNTLQALKHEGVYVIGDATNVPTSKAGSVAHYEADVVVFNIMAEIHGVKPEEIFDGHSTCFIVYSKGTASLIDFNYKIEPLPGQFPAPHLGPFSLLKETKANWWGKLAFEPLYWNVLLGGRHLGMPPTLVMAGKEVG